MKPLHFFTRLFLIASLCTMMSGTLLANGNETLGPPSIPIATGSGYVANGVGLTLAQPGIININVPVLSTIKQVLLYWEGQHFSGAGDNTIVVNGNTITGTVIGGPNFFYNNNGNAATPVYSTTYRADITSLNIVQLGANALSVGGLSFTKANNGAGIMVIYDDGSGLSNIQIRDGNDIAYKFFPAPRTATVPQTFTFLSAPVARVAKLKMFFSSVEGTISTGQQRPNRIAVTVGGVTTNYDNVLNSNDGEEWDTYQVDVNIPAGQTSVTVEAISGPGGSSSGSPDPRPASLAWIAAGFSVPPPCSGQIGDFIWKDCNSNGLQDPGEDGIAGVTVYLKNTGGTILATTTTDVNGYYYFNTLCAGNYVVEVNSSTLPPGLTPTTCANTPNIANNSNCSPSPVTLTTNSSTDLTIDFGYKGTALIGDFVWIDGNCDGIQDLGEIGISNVTVWLKQNGVIVKTAVTDVNGKYEFTGICGGDYVVEVDTTTLPAGARTQTTCSNTPGVGNNSNCNPSNVTIVDGQIDRTIDFGYCCTGMIGDYIWKDCNGNGIQDPNEAGIANVTVYLKDSNGNILATTTTDANGLYYFNNLCLGNYIVEVDETTMPPGLTQTTCSNAAGIANNSNCSPSPVSLTLNNSVDLTIDFGYKGNGLIGDFVWKDANCDGIQDLGELGISNVTVWLKQNGVIVNTAVTDANGKYEFSGICGGTYVVEVDTTTLPPGTRTQTTCSNTPGVANNSNCSPSSVTIIDGQIDRTIDFGYCTTTICLKPPSTSPCPTEGTFMIPQVLPNGDLLLYFEQTTGVNDNSYGTNKVGWGAKTHTFSNLTGSDKAQFVFYNGNNQKVLDITVDYISAKTGTPSGFASLGVSGGDGSVAFGSAAHVLMATTSLDYNLNSLGLCVGGNCNSGGVDLKVNSPPTTGPNSYTVTNPIHSGWVFPITYTVKIAAAAFGPSGFGRVTVPAIHNSPPKCGSNAIAYNPCDGPQDPNVCAGGVKPGTLRMVYTGFNCSASNNPQSGKATCTDHAALQSTVRILITDKSSPTDSKAKKWFDGVRNLNDTIDVKASNAGATTFGTDTYYYIYSTGGQLLQSGKFHTSCSQPLLVGNQFGTLLLVGFKPQGVPKMIEEMEGMPEAYRLMQNYPNPFNPQTEIYFQMPEGGNMTLKIFNTLGQEVKTLVDGYMDAGIHGVTWDATDHSGNAVSSGIYFYQMRSGDFTSMKKMSLLR